MGWKSFQVPEDYYQDDQVDNAEECDQPDFHPGITKECIYEIADKRINGEYRVDKGILHHSRVPHAKTPVIPDISITKPLSVPDGQIHNEGENKTKGFFPVFFHQVIIKETEDRNNYPDFIGEQGYEIQNY